MATLDALAVSIDPKDTPPQISLLAMDNIWYWIFNSHCYGKEGATTRTGGYLILWFHLYQIITPSAYHH